MTAFALLILSETLWKKIEHIIQWCSRKNKSTSFRHKRYHGCYQKISHIISSQKISRLLSIDITHHFVTKDITVVMKTFIR